MSLHCRYPAKLSLRNLFRDSFDRAAPCDRASGTDPGPRKEIRAAVQESCVGVTRGNPRLSNRPGFPPLVTLKGRSGMHALMTMARIRRVSPVPP